MPALNVISSPSPVFSVDISVPFNVNINGEQNDQSGLSGRMHSVDKQKMCILFSKLYAVCVCSECGVDSKCFDDTTAIC